MFYVVGGKDEQNAVFNIIIDLKQKIKYQIFESADT